MPTEKVRTIFIGDVHGCLDELNEMLELIKVKAPEARIIMLGDLLDRGPNSVGVVKRCRELGLESVKGNHEDKFVKWFCSQGTKVDFYDRRDYYSQLSDEDIQYIMNMPLYIEMDDVVAVHAGVKPGVLMSNQTKDDCMYLRYTDEKRRFISLKKINKVGKEEAGAKFWTEFGPFTKNIVYGHNVNSYYDIRIDEYTDNTACYGIDTGVCFGGKLSALIWETRELIQVSAKKVYYKSDYDIR